MTEATQNYELLNITARIVGSYVGNNSVDINEIPLIINKVHSTIQDLVKFGANTRKSDPLNPFVPISESFTDDYIICLEDGKKLQMLKRHLNTMYKMTIEEYKERWNLTADYPVVAPNYAKRRSQIAKNTGLGQSGRSKKIRFEQHNKNGLTQVAAVANK